MKTQRFTRSTMFPGLTIVGHLCHIKQSKQYVNGICYFHYITTHCLFCFAAVMSVMLLELAAGQTAQQSQSVHATYIIP
jgi:hypothetical protein